MFLIELRNRLRPLMPVPVKKKKKKRKSLSEMAIAIVGRRRKSLSDAAKAGLVVIPNKIRKRFSGAVR